MKRTIKLRNVCACEIPAALAALGKEVMSHLGPNHPPCPMLELLKLERHHVPLGVDLTGCLADYGLFTELPSPYHPLGKRVLGAAVKLCAACGNQGCPGAADCGQCCGPCRRCGCAYGSELAVYITLHPDFPFPPADVECFFYRYFNMPELAAAMVTHGYHNLYDITHEVNALATARLVAPPGAARDVLLSGPASEAGPTSEPAPASHPGIREAPFPAQPAQRRKPGAPQLDCNAWLYKTMCAMPDPRAYGPLRPEWKERYLRQMGVEPVDLDKSFREAARHYLHRILGDRGEQDGLEEE